MSQHRTERPREIELYIARRIKRLDDAALLKIIEQLRNLATTETHHA